MFSKVDTLVRLVVRSLPAPPIFTQIVEWMGPQAVQRLQGLLTVAVPGGTSMFVEAIRNRRGATRAP